MLLEVLRENINEVDDILDLAENIGVKRVVFFNFIPVGRGVEIAEYDLDPFTREEFMRHIYREMRRRKLEIYTTAPQYGRVVVQLSRGLEVAPTHCVVRGDPVVTAIAEFIGGCGAGRIYAAIQPNGVVTPCVFMPIPAGSLRERSFKSIWVNSVLMKSLRSKDTLGGYCGKCPYRNVCGGCRARAYAYFKNPLGPDPGCIYNYAILKSRGLTTSPWSPVANN
jgi:radical SAM protein with 4Fe4S-binding SPASM domain